jgi:hypothetical protein
MVRARPGAAAAALVLLLALGPACSGGVDLPETPTTTSTVATTTSTTLRLPEGAPLVVAEQGVTSFPDPYDESQTLGGYGVVLENPNSDLLAAGVQVTTRLLDAAGTELLVDRSLLNGIMPGQRMAVGRTLVEPIAGPSQLDISVVVAAWLPPAATGGLTAQEAVTAPEAFGGAATSFAIQSTWPHDEEGVDVTAVYRAEDGRILAAETTTIDLLPAGDLVVGRIRLLAPIPGLASTEVLVGRGFDAQTAG